MTEKGTPIGVNNFATEARHAAHDGSLLALQKQLDLQGGQRQHRSVHLGDRPVDSLLPDEGTGDVRRRPGSRGNGEG